MSSWIKLRNEFSEGYLKAEDRQSFAIKFAFENGLSVEKRDEWINTVEKIKEDSPGLITCEKCGAEYSEKLPACPGCEISEARS